MLLLPMFITVLRLRGGADESDSEDEVEFLRSSVAIRELEDEVKELSKIEQQKLLEWTMAKCKLNEYKLRLGELKAEAAKSRKDKTDARDSMQSSRSSASHISPADVDLRQLLRLASNGDVQQGANQRSASTRSPSPSSSETSLESATESGGKKRP